jgi:hypothetical protein
MTAPAVPGNDTWTVHPLDYEALPGQLLRRREYAPKTGVKLILSATDASEILDYLSAENGVHLFAEKVKTYAGVSLACDLGVYANQLLIEPLEPNKPVIFSVSGKDGQQHVADGVGGQDGTEGHSLTMYIENMDDEKISNISFQTRGGRGGNGGNTFLQSENHQVGKPGGSGKNAGHESFPFYLVSWPTANIKYR